LLQNTEVTEGADQPAKVVTPVADGEDAKPTYKQSVDLCIIYCWHLSNNYFSWLQHTSFITSVAQTCTQTMDIKYSTLTTVPWLSRQCRCRCF